MNGTKQLAEMINTKCHSNVLIMNDISNSAEPLREMVYHGLGEDVASTIDGTDLYHEIVDHLEEIY